MASSKSLVSLVLLMLISLAAETPQLARAQTCTAELSRLNVCAPFVVPGSINSNPSPECCGALQAVPSDCLCNTLRIASRLPAQCNLPSLTCTN